MSGAKTVCPPTRYIGYQAYCEAGGYATLAKCLGEKDHARYGRDLAGVLSAGC